MDALGASWMNLRDTVFVSRMNFRDGWVSG